MIVVLLAIVPLDEIQTIMCNEVRTGRVHSMMRPELEECI